MRLGLIALLLLCSGLLCLCTSQSSAFGAKRKDILLLGQKAVNKWLQENKLNCGWEDGTFMIGLAIFQEATQDPQLLQAMVDFGESNHWNLCVQLGGGAWHADNQICAATYAQLQLSSATKNSTWTAAAVAHLDAEIAKDASTVGAWNWVDALFMAMSVYSRIGALTGNPVYFQKMFKNFVHSALTPHPQGYAFFSRSEHLFYRDPPKTNPDGVFWSRGNGWVAAALVQALRFSPPADPHVATYRAVYVQLMSRLVQLQGEDGCWRSSLTDPDFYAVPETTGTALFTYAMAYGLSAGILDTAAYLPVVQRSWSCLTTVSLHADGSIGNCQPVGWAPRPDFGRESTSSFCVGQFAMAAAAVAQLAQA